MTSILISHLQTKCYQCVQACTCGNIIICKVYSLHTYICTYIMYVCTYVHVCMYICSKVLYMTCSSPSTLPGVLNGVPRTSFGVCTALCCGVIPSNPLLRSTSREGVSEPVDGLRGVSVVVRASRFCASYKS